MKLGDEAGTDAVEIGDPAPASRGLGTLELTGEQMQPHGVILVDLLNLEKSWRRI